MATGPEAPPPQFLAETDGRAGDAEPPVPVGARPQGPRPGLAAVQAGRLPPLPAGHAAGRHRLRRRTQPRLRPAAAEGALDGVPAQPAQPGAEVAQDALPPAEGPALPQ